MEMSQNNFVNSGVSFDLETERLTMKRICLDDSELVFALRSNDEVTRFTGIGPYTSVDDAVRYIQRINREIDDGSCIMWSIILSSTHEPAGTICFWNFSHDKKTAEIGYDLLTEYWGHGYMPEAIRKALAFGFFTFGLEAVLAEPRTENTSSTSVLEKSGFCPVKEYMRSIENGSVKTSLYEIKKSEFKI